MKKLITDKTLAAFEKWFYENHGKCSKNFEELLSWEKSEIMDYLFNACETIQHAFLIEFFDSVGICIEINKQRVIMDPSFWKAKINNILYDDLKYKRNRPEATEKALEKANVIFNNR